MTSKAFMPLAFVTDRLATMPAASAWHGSQPHGRRDGWNKCPGKTTSGGPGNCRFWERRAMQVRSWAPAWMARSGGRVQLAQ